MERVISISIILLFLGLIPLAGQTTDLAGKSLVRLQREGMPEPVALNAVSAFPVRTFFWRKPKPTYNSLQLKSALLSPQTAPTVYSYDNLAFFCRIDVQLEQSVGVPVKFRLGEVQMVEQMERQRASAPYYLDLPRPKH